jgi:hypothetical protein
VDSLHGTVGRSGFFTLAFGAIMPIVNMVSICLALSIILCLCALLRRRRQNTQKRAYSVPGGSITIYAALSDLWNTDQYMGCIQC